MKLWKFLVPSDRFYPVPEAPGISVSGCVAVVLAESVLAARQVIEAASAEAGKDSRWLSIAVVTEIPLDKPRLVAVAF